MTLTNDELQTLQDNLTARSTTPFDERNRCRICGSGEIERKTKGAARREYDTKYRCSKGHHFDEPVRVQNRDELAERFGGVDA